MNPKHNLTLIVSWNGYEMTRAGREFKDQDFELAVPSLISEILDDMKMAGQMVVENNPELAQEVGYQGIVITVDAITLMKTRSLRPIKVKDVPKEMEVYQMAIGRSFDKLAEIDLTVKKLLGNGRKW